MDASILKNFVGKNVEILVDGQFLEGNLKPIAKGVVVLTPTKNSQAFYGVTSVEAIDVKAIREIKDVKSIPAEIIQKETPPEVKSGFESLPMAKNRFILK